MSIDYGDLAGAFRGKAEDLRTLGPAAEKWLKKQDTAGWDQALVEEIRRFAGMFALEGRDGGSILTGREMSTSSWAAWTVPRFKRRRAMYGLFRPMPSGPSSGRRAFGSDVLCCLLQI